VTTNVTISPKTNTVTINSTTSVVSISSNSPTVRISSQGTQGIGVPAGGAINQVLSKTSSTDYATAWVDQAGAATNVVKISDAPLSRTFYADDASFNTAAAAAGKDYPTPSITRFDLPPQSINLKDCGLVASNSGTNASANVLAFQAVIDWLAGKTNGGAIYSTSDAFSYNNPIYALNSPVILKKKVSLLFGPEVRFRATASMAAMLDTTVGSANRLTDAIVTGGFWDGNRLADRIFRFAEFQNLRVGGNGMVLKSAVVAGIDVGNTGASANPYELYLNDFKIANSSSAFTGTPIGIVTSGNVSDSSISNIVIQGYAYGVQGNFFSTTFNEVHTWASAVAEGQHLRGFDLTGGKIHLVECAVDEPYNTGYYINAPEIKMVACRSTMTTAALDNTINVVTLGASATEFSIDSSFGNDRSNARFLNLVSGHLSDTTVGISNTVGFGNKPVYFNNGYPDTHCSIQVNTGSAPTVLSSKNIASVTRNSDKDFTFNFTYAMPDTNFSYTVGIIPINQPDTIIWRTRDIGTTQLRIQTLDLLENYDQASKIIIWAGR
jgi:hypothetical protein